MKFLAHAQKLMAQSQIVCLNLWDSISLGLTNMYDNTLLVTSRENYENMGE